METRLEAARKAEELESQLDPEYPSFVKPMLHSHVVRGFWLVSAILLYALPSKFLTHLVCINFVGWHDQKGLPRHFCETYLPKHDSIVTLVDEKDEEFKTNYLAYKNGLSGGWAGFALCHGLLDGDATVFQLIKPTTFKVIQSTGRYIWIMWSCDLNMVYIRIMWITCRKWIAFQVYIIRATVNDGNEVTEWLHCATSLLTYQEMANRILGMV